MSITWNKTVKTRKDHTCYGCYELIPKGTLTDLSWGYADCWWRTYLCKACLVYIAEHNLIDDDSGLEPGAVRDDRLLYDN